MSCQTCTIPRDLQEKVIQPTRSNSIWNIQYFQLCSQHLYVNHKQPKEPLEVSNLHLTLQRQYKYINDHNTDNRWRFHPLRFIPCPVRFAVSEIFRGSIGFGGKCFKKKWGSGWRQFHVLPIRSPFHDFYKSNILVLPLCLLHMMSGLCSCNLWKGEV